MREFGVDIGTSFRVVFGYHGVNEVEPEPTKHRSKYMPANFEPGVGYVDKK